MAVLQDHLFHGLHVYYQQIDPYVRPLRQSILSTVGPALEFAQSFFSNGPDLANLALLLVVLILSFKLLDMLRRTVFYWVLLLTKVIFWAVVIVICVFMWQRGPETVFGVFWSWATDLAGFFQEELERWEQATSNAQRARATKPQW